MRSGNKSRNVCDNEESVRIDMWPDVSEYEKTYPTGLKLSGGETARFFCSDDESTVETHFRWMEEYGLDGMFLQRLFVSATCQTIKEREESITVVHHALKATQRHSRAPILKRRRRCFKIINPLHRVSLQRMCDGRSTSAPHWGQTYL